jgi:choline dehydrogenase-like flavoprotein
MASADTYDFIIVGAGSAGCVLANKLSADPGRRVLLIESGPDDTSPLIKMPRGTGKFLNPGNPHVWDFAVLPGGNQPPEIWLKGKGIGGSSAINGMVYMRGGPLDYDGWAAQGCTGWGWGEIGRCFKELEDHELGAAAWRGAGGPIPVSVHARRNGLTESILQAIQEMGVALVADINDVDVVRDGGMGYQTCNIRNGERFSAARAFLAPVRSRPNLDLLVETDALRVELDGRRVTGVTVRDKIGARFIGAREVILSAGAIQSPRLLQLSGIGPGAVLQAAGVPVLLDSPDVGRNLREHRFLQTVYRVRSGSMNRHYRGLRLANAVLQYGLRRKGALTHAAHEVGGFVKTRPGLENADAQIGVSLHSLKYDERGLGVDAHDGLTILGYFTRPESQGEIRIQSSDPDVAPRIDANHFSAEVDRLAAVSLFRWLRELGRQPSLRPWIVEEQSPGPQIATDEDILENALSLGGAAFHIAGTARMGSDPRAVCDTQLRVRGVDGLRVCDTSVMPTLVSGNTNAPAMAIALRASELILENHGACAGATHVAGTRPPSMRFRR